MIKNWIQSQKFSLPNREGNQSSERLVELTLHQSKPGPDKNEEKGEAFHCVRETHKYMKPAVLKM
jgi:hypothetical protein